MSATTLIVTALFAQSAFTMALASQPDENVDVGYAELQGGKPQAAIDSIEANRDLESDDPAALINLGNAYAQLGNTERASEYYRAAIASNQRYNLELADGSWMDSRQAAKKALKALGNQKASTNAMQAMAD